MGNLKCVGNGCGEVVSTDWEGSNPTSIALGNHHIRCGGSNVNEYNWVGFIVEFEVVVHGVEERQRTERKDFRTQADLTIQAKQFGNLLPSHRKETDFDLRGILILKYLVIPLNLIDRKWNLLHCLKLDDVGDLFGLDRRQLGESHQGRVPLNGHHNEFIIQLFLADQLAQRHSHHLRHIDVWCAQHPLVWNHGVVRNLDLIADPLQAKGLDGKCPDFNAPCCVRGCHAGVLFGPKT